MTKKKTFNTELDDILNDLDLPSDQDIREETGKVNRANGLKNPNVRAKISKSLKESSKFHESIANRDQSFRDDPTYRKVHTKRMQNLRKDPEFVEKQKKGMEALRNDPVRWAEYQKKYNKGNKAKLEDPSFWEAYYASIKIRDADPEYHKKRIDASKKKICRRVQTPLGVFDSITDAANAHGMGNTETMRHRLKSPNFPDFLLLDDVAKKPQKKK